MKRHAPSLPLLLFATATTCLLSACNGGQATKAAEVGPIGDAAHGKQLIAGYGCGACHMIPGVDGARGLVGPPLFYFSERTMIAGELPNTPDNLVRWIQNPRDVEPKTAMPDLGLSESQAYDIAAYLYTIRGRKGTPWID
jgi:cytochrome c1